MSKKISVVIPAAGLAVRLQPLTTAKSKCMVDVNGKPALEYILDELSKRDNIEECIVVGNSTSTDITNYVDSVQDKYSFKLATATQFKPNGPADAISYGLDMCRDDTSLVIWLGDAIILNTEVLPFGENFLLTKSNVDDESKWCMYNQSSNIYFDKPKDSTPAGSKALVGVYSFEDIEIAKNVFRKNEYDISPCLIRSFLKFATVDTNDWYDIGETSSYHKTRAALLNLKSRDFNRFHFDPKRNTITKYSTRSEILNPEINWYKSLTNYQKLYVPKFIETLPGELCLSLEGGVLLSDMMDNENISESTWYYIIKSIMDIVTREFHECYSGDINPIEDFRYTANCHWVEKSISRLSVNNNQSILNKTGYKEKLESFANELAENVRPVPYMHGDLHFGNILYDPVINKFTFLDPRGKYGGIVTTCGDHLYDWCKMAHDLYLGYNDIVRGGKGEVPDSIKNAFLKVLREHNVDEDLVIMGGILLMATCIPLHYEDEDRQTRLKDRVIKELEKYERI